MELGLATCGDTRRRDPCLLPKLQDDAEACFYQGQSVSLQENTFASVHCNASPVESHCSRTGHHSNNRRDFVRGQ